MNWWFEWVLSLLPDNCEMPDCKRKGVRGNEVVLDGIVMCDDCMLQHPEAPHNKKKRMPQVHRWTA